MPNPTDFERMGNETERGTLLMESGLETAGTKMSWSEWFNSAWAGQNVSAGALHHTVAKTSGVIQEMAGEKLAARALTLGLSAITGTWAIGVVAILSVEFAFANAEDKAKELIPAWSKKAREALGRWRYGGRQPDLVLDRPITRQGSDSIDIEGTLERVKENTGGLQGLLNALAGNAGKAYYCDDAYQLAAMAHKAAGTKAQLKADIAVMQEFLTRLDGDLNRIDPTDILTKVNDLTKAIVDSNDGRHWDNSRTQYYVTFAKHCSKQHCFGPRVTP